MRKFQNGYWKATTGEAGRKRVENFTCSLYKCEQSFFLEGRVPNCVKY